MRICPSPSDCKPNQATQAFLYEGASQLTALRLTLNSRLDPPAVFWSHGLLLSRRTAGVGYDRGCETRIGACSSDWASGGADGHGFGYFNLTSAIICDISSGNAPALNSASS